MSEGTALGIGPSQCQRETGPVGPGLLPSAGTRDIFPLPTFSVVAVSPGLSRGCAQRSARRRKKITVANDAIHALNWMHSGRFGLSPCADSHAPDPMQSEVLERIQVLSEEAGALGILPCTPSPEAALRELLHGRSEYMTLVPILRLLAIDLGSCHCLTRWWDVLALRTWCVMRTASY